MSTLLYRIALSRPPEANSIGEKTASFGTASLEIQRAIQHQLGRLLPLDEGGIAISTSNVDTTGSFLLNIQLSLLSRSPSSETIQAVADAIRRTFREHGQEAQAHFDGWTDDNVAVGTAITQNLRLWIDPGDASPEDIAELLAAISDLHRAHGGSGLAYRIDGEHVLAAEEELA